MSSIAVRVPKIPNLTDPPADPFEGGGGGSGWMRLTIASNDIEAHLVTGRLLEAGIESTTVKDRTGHGTWMYGGSNPWAPVTILVRRLQLEDAQLVLAEIAFEAPSAPARRTNVNRSWWGPVLWWTAAIALGILFTALGWVRANETIESCERPAGCESPARP